MSGDRPKPPFLDKKLFHYCLELYHGWSLIDLPDNCSVQGQAAFENPAESPSQEDAFTSSPCRLLIRASQAGNSSLLWTAGGVSKGIEISGKYATVALHHMFPLDRLEALALQLDGMPDAENAIASYKRVFYKLYGELNSEASPELRETVDEASYLKAEFKDMVAWNPGNLFTGPEPERRLDDSCKGMEGQHVFNACRKLFFSPAAGVQQQDPNEEDAGGYAFVENLQRQIMQQDANIGPIEKLQSWTKVLSSGIRVGLFTFNRAIIDKQPNVFKTLGQKQRLIAERVKRILEERGLPLEQLDNFSIFKEVFAALEKPSTLQAAVSSLFSKLQLKDMQTNTAIFTFTSKKGIDPTAGEKSLRCKGLSADGGINEAQVKSIAKRLTVWSKDSWANTK